MRREPLDKDKGYNYYIRERDGATNAQELVSKEIESKIATLEAKRDAQLRAINSEYEVKIEALERKKESEMIKLRNRIDDRQRDIDGIRAKFDNAKPTSTSYSKLVSDRDQTTKEIETAQYEMSQASITLQHSHKKDNDRRVREENSRLQFMARENALIELEKKKRIEQDRQNIIKQDIEKAKKRTEEAKMAAAASLGPPKLQFAVTFPSKEERKLPKNIEKLSFPLDPKKQYTVDQLDTIHIDYDVNDPHDCEMWEKLRREACLREGVFGAWECKDDEPQD
jgi:hypothetical protein